MTLWLDEQISPFLATWVEENFGVICNSVVGLPVNRGDDEEIFMRARQAHAVIVSKDSDFFDLVNRLGTPPQLIWLTCGNRSNALTKQLLSVALPKALELLRSGESIVEIA